MDTTPQSEPDPGAAAGSARRSGDHLRRVRRNSAALKSARSALTIAACGVLLALSTSSLDACPRCIGSTGRGALTAYYLSAVVLSLLPPVIFGTVFFFVRRQLRHPQPPPPGPPQRD